MEFANGISPINILPNDVVEAGAILLRYVVDANAPLGLGYQPKTDDTYLAARFVEHVNDAKLSIRETLASLSAVGFLFRIADEIGVPGSKRSVSLKVVADGPIILDYLGCSGPLRAETAGEIFEGLRSMGAQVVTFGHCVDEAHDVLRSVLKANPIDRYGPTGEALRRGLVHENVLLSLLQAFDVAVRSKGIEILPDDLKFMPNSHMFFDEEKSKEIEKIINWHDESNESAIFADADTTTLTIRRRSGHRTSDIFDSRFICVTNNEKFAGATRRHLQDITYYNKRQVPPVVTLKELSAKLWMELGGGKSGSQFSIPNRQLLISCDRALRLNRKVVDKATAELAKIRPDQVKQFELLLEVPRSARAVMDATLNNERRVSGATIEQLLEAAVDAAGAEAAARERDRRLKERVEFERKLADYDVKLELEKKKALETEGDVRKLVEKFEEENSEAINSLVSRAFERFRKISSYIRMLSIIIAIAPILLGINSMIFGSAGWYGILGYLLVSILGFAGAMDKPGSWLSGKIKSWLESGVVRDLRAIAKHDAANSISFEWKSDHLEWSLD